MAWRHQATLKRWPSSTMPNDDRIQNINPTLLQVMACCLTAPSHYLKQRWPRGLRGGGGGTYKITRKTTELLYSSVTRLMPKNFYYDKSTEAWCLTTIFAIIREGRHMNLKFAGLTLQHSNTKSIPRNGKVVKGLFTNTGMIKLSHLRPLHWQSSNPSDDKTVTLMTFLHCE